MEEEGVAMREILVHRVEEEGAVITGEEVEDIIAQVAVDLTLVT